MVGSSPLTRGKRIVIKHSCNKHGLIPAHAGKTRGMRAECAVPTAHPRSRGENEIQTHLSEVDGGSSPLTRGKLSFCNVRDVAFRLIPAHAGKTLWSAGKSLIDGAHPRSRGENCGPVHETNGRPGSSPLTRGKRRLDQVDQAGGRLIPAHAGKTQLSQLPP